jgi:hypothetical protein
MNLNKYIVNVYFALALGLLLGLVVVLYILDHLNGQ